MNCNCRWVETVLAIVIVVFALWQVNASQWIIAIAAILLLLHANTCKNCRMCGTETMTKSSPKKKK